MFNYRSAALSAIVAASALSTGVQAGETQDEIIEIMRENGSITQEQYARLKQASAEEQKTQAESSWADRLSFEGDLRLRHEYEDNDDRRDANGDQVDRDRQRFRFRFGLEAAVSERLTVGAGLASGGDDPRSTNQSLTNNFSTKSINLDYAYAEYAVTDMLNVIGGKFKFKNYLWQPTDTFWDGDINPEGVSASYRMAAGKGEFFANAGYWILNEFSSNGDDPSMYYLQLGQTMKAGDLFGTIAGVHYGYINADEMNAFPFSEGTNTDDEFDSVGLSAEFGTKIPKGKVSLIADYLVNTETDSSEDSGYGIGGKLSLGRWGFKYIYVDLEANAVPDIFPDSDRFGGQTDIEGHEIAGKYQLTKKVALGLDIYQTESKATGADETLVQADIEIDFP